MSDVDEDETRSDSGDSCQQSKHIAESSGSSSLSMKSDLSKDPPLDFSGEPRSSATKRQQSKHTAESSGSSSLSMKSDWSKDRPLDFSGEPRSSATKEKKKSDEEQPERSSSRAEPRVGLQQLLRDHKKSLRSTHEYVTEGSEEPGEVILLNSIYTDLHVTEDNTVRSFRRIPTFQDGYILQKREY